MYDSESVCYTNNRVSDINTESIASERLQESKNIYPGRNNLSFVFKIFILIKINSKKDKLP